MQQIYLKRLTKQDITKSVAICSESVESFWDIDSKATDQYTPISICHIDNSDYFPPEITIHKGYGGEKDWRICGNEWKKLYAHDNPNVGDIMVVRKLNTRCFSVEIVNQGTPSYEILSMLFNGNDNYVLLSKEAINEGKTTNLPLQQIFYGAPSTGKSHGIKYNEKVIISDEKNLVFRTTFHPDSDYSTFVGAYKPTLKPVADKYKAVAGKDEEITYEFIPQAFLQAYIAAWNNREEDVFLVIEEINRGNCAQIFGDLFQLLDRDDNGFSEYPIMADRDLAKFLTSNDVLVNKDGIKDGKLMLPANLYIWATMNTSDQSLFPIDSAFKRRWEWKYVPIDTKKEEWHILVNGHKYSWTSFLDIINDEVLTDETAEDKHLGFYFCKAENRIISAEKLVGKVLFYLWNDVFKVYGVPSRVTNGSKDMTYPKFYNTDGTVNEDMVEQLLDNLGVDRIEPDGDDDPTEPDDNA